MRAIRFPQPHIARDVAIVGEPVTFAGAVLGELSDPVVLVSRPAGSALIAGLEVTCDVVGVYTFTLGEQRRRVELLALPAGVEECPRLIERRTGDRTALRVLRSLFRELGPDGADWSQLTSEKPFPAEVNLVAHGAPPDIASCQGRNPSTVNNDHATTTARDVYAGARAEAER